MRPWHVLILELHHVHVHLLFVPFTVSLFFIAVSEFVLFNIATRIAYNAI